MASPSAAISSTEPIATPLKRLSISNSTFKKEKKITEGAYAPSVCIELMNL